MSKSDGTLLVEIVERLLNLRFEPAGTTADPDVPTSASIADYLGRRLTADYLNPTARDAPNSTASLVPR